MGRLALSWVLVLPSLLAANAAAQTTAKGAAHPGAAETAPANAGALLRQELFGTIPISSHSEEARKFAELSLEKYEDGLMDDAVVHARHATEKDPQCALAYALLSFVSRSGIPDPAALAKAKALLPGAAPDEALLVRWMTSIQDRDLLPAILNINSLLQRYPKDKHILFLAAQWLYYEQDYDRALGMMEAVEKLDPNFAPVLRMLGVAYIESGDPQPGKAIAALERYAALEPSAPNPEEALGEVLSRSGNDQAALEHYGAALQIDPTYFPSQIGLANTLALMGSFADARREYDRASQVADNARDELHAKYKKALVYFWEGQPEQGRKALDSVATEAARRKEPNAQIEIGLGRAMLASTYQEELKQLGELSALFETVQEGMNEADRSAARAAVLRERVRIAALHKLNSDATDSVAKLEQFATASRDQIVESAYESARGFLLVSQGDLGNAADELAQDPHSPLALAQLAATQEKLGNTPAAATARLRLKFQRKASAEWYLVTHGSAGGDAK